MSQISRLQDLGAMVAVMQSVGFVLEEIGPQSPLHLPLKQNAMHLEAWELPTFLA